MNDVSNDVAINEQLQRSYWQRFTLDLKHRVTPIITHGVAMNVFILCMAVTERNINFALGHDIRFFDVLPLRYLVQTVDLLLIVRFTASVWREYR
jgi:hypothetical protein